MGNGSCDSIPEEELDMMPEGMDATETGRYLLAMAFPDASSQEIEDGVRVLESTTLSQLRDGGRLTMDTVYEAAAKLEPIFPVKDDRRRTHPRRR